MLRRHHHALLVEWRKPVGFGGHVVRTRRQRLNLKRARAVGGGDDRLTVGCSDGDGRTRDDRAGLVSDLAVERGGRCLRERGGAEKQEYDEFDFPQIAPCLQKGGFRPRVDLCYHSPSTYLLC